MSKFNLSHSESSPGERQGAIGNVIEFSQRSYSRAAGLIGDSGSRIKQQFTPNEDAAPWKGLVAGLVAGLAATAAMTAFQLGWSKAKSAIQRAGSDETSSEAQADQDESSTVKVAEVISENVRGRTLRTEEKDPASYAVHFAFGTLMGGVYGISSEYLPIARLGHGLFHGLALWAGADALALPALNLSKPATERSIGELAYEVMAHAVYGVASESVRKTVRDWIE